MKVFNLENLPKGLNQKSLKSCECIVIATFEEWQMICDAVESASKSSPKKKKLQQLHKSLGYLAIY